MINVFVLQNGRLNQIPIDSREDLASVTPVWLDLTDPSDEERDWVSGIFGVRLPDEDEVKDMEASARYYEADNGDLHLRSDFLLEEDDNNELKPYGACTSECGWALQRITEIITVKKVKQKDLHHRHR